jgi:hypothetical protein
MLYDLSITSKAARLPRIVYVASADSTRTQKTPRSRLSSASQYRVSPQRSPSSRTESPPTSTPADTASTSARNLFAAVAWSGAGGRMFIERSARGLLKLTLTLFWILAAQSRLFPVNFNAPRAYSLGSYRSANGTPGRSNWWPTSMRAASARWCPGTWSNSESGIRRPCFRPRSTLRCSDSGTQTAP